MVARWKARLLELLKFRVLAAQESFFADLMEYGGKRSDPERFRRWLAPLWPEALALDEEALLATLASARHLYGASMWWMRVAVRSGSVNNSSCRQ
jgi:hypothetical protein